MRRERKLTIAEKLLLAAYDLDKGRGSVFSAEDLVVAAWRKFPRAFGLRGHDNEEGFPAYPDSNRVFAEVMGSKPIRKKGYLKKLGQKRYGLTPSGQDAARRLAGEREEVASEAGEGKATISRESLEKLQRLLGSRVVKKAQDGEYERLTFHDACLFWGITPRSAAIELEGRLQEVESLVSEMRRAIGAGASELSTGKEDLAPGTADLIADLNRELQERFAPELATIRTRRDQRRA